jgi:hypothetical protein
MISCDAKVIPVWESALCARGRYLALRLGTTFVSFLTAKNLVLKNFTSTNSWIHWRKLPFSNLFLKIRANNHSKEQAPVRDIGTDYRLLQWRGRPHQRLLISPPLLSFPSYQLNYEYKYGRSPFPVLKYEDSLLRIFHYQVETKLYTIGPCSSTKMAKTAPQPGCQRINQIN